MRLSMTASKISDLSLYIIHFHFFIFQINHEFLAWSYIDGIYYLLKFS